MDEKMSRDRVKGFLDVKDGKIVNGDGEEIILSGWGLGNWLLCEGYMWLSRGSNRFDRPRRIEAVLDELAGKEYTKEFWKKFCENYITEADVKAMAELGYNSVRVPINYRLFMEESEELIWIEDGFAILDRFLEWCEKYRIYAFIDLHGAPGGQTGANIDDCIDDMPRLFLDQHNFDRGVALWRRIAQRYKDRWIVGGYDLLNEPIRPKRTEKDIDVDYLVPRLIEFYEKSIEAVREIDRKHLFTLEGHHWASEQNVFSRKYDEKAVLHFHRYGVVPDISSLQPYIDTANKWGMPLWLGESGENIPEWFAALYPLSAELGIGYNIWPWKKMDTRNSPFSVRKPEGWEALIDYCFGGPHPGYEKSRKLLDSYLENMKFENCVYNHKVHASVLRQPGCTIKAVDFDELPGIGESFSGIRKEENPYCYRINTYMKIVDRDPLRSRQGGFDSMWDRLALELEEGEFAVYTLNDTKEENSLRIECMAQEDSVLRIEGNGQLMREYEVDKSEKVIQLPEISLIAAGKCAIKVSAVSGSVILTDMVTS